MSSYILDKCYLSFGQNEKTGYCFCNLYINDIRFKSVRISPMEYEMLLIQKEKGDKNV